MNSSTDNDGDLLSRVRQDDEGALKELLRKYYVPLGEFSFSMLRRRDLAQEAVSNVFLNVWRRRRSLVIKTNVRSYLFTAVGNQSLNLRKHRFNHVTVGLDEVRTPELIDARGSDSDILYRELHDEIDAILSRLPSQRQLVFRMNRIEGLTYPEIARMLDVSEHTVQNHMVQAMRQLGHELPKLRSALEWNSTQNRAEPDRARNAR